MLLTGARIQFRILRRAALATTALAPVVVGLSAIAAGSRGAVGAALGITIVVLFFSLSNVALARVPGVMLLPAALGVYLAKIIALGFSLSALRRAPFVDSHALGYTTLAALVIWLGTQVTLFHKAPLPYVDPAARG